MTITKERVQNALLREICHIPAKSFSHQNIKPMIYNFEEKLSTDTSRFFRWSPKILNMFFESEDVLPMWIAETEFKACPELVEALKERANEGVFCYEDKTNRVREAVVGWFQRRHNVQMKADNLQFTISVLAGLAALLEEFTAEDEGVIIQPPVYQAFTMILNGINRKIVHNPLRLEDGKYQIDFEDLERKLSDPKNKVFLMCSPHNPVARVWTKEELTEVAELCNKYDVLCISDEIHCDTLLYGNKFASMTEVGRGIINKLVIIGSAGKTFGIPSLSDAYIYTENQDLQKVIGERLFRYHINKSNAFSNTAMEAVYTLGDAWVDQFNQHVQKNVDLIRSHFDNSATPIKLIEPEGTYQVWLDCSDSAHTDELLHRKLVDTGKIGLARGSGYGPGGEKFFRMNIGCPPSTLTDALSRIENAFN